MLILVNALLDHTPDAQPFTYFRPGQEKSCCDHRNFTDLAGREDNAFMKQA
jgi:hypothetical protein